MMNVASVLQCPSLLVSIWLWWSIVTLQEIVDATSVPSTVSSWTSFFSQVSSSRRVDDHTTTNSTLVSGVLSFTKQSTLTAKLSATGQSLLSTRTSPSVRVALESSPTSSSVTSFRISPSSVRKRRVSTTGLRSSGDVTEIVGRKATVQLYTSTLKLHPSPSGVARCGVNTSSLAGGRAATTSLDSKSRSSTSVRDLPKTSLLASRLNLSSHARNLEPSTDLPWEVESSTLDIDATLSILVLVTDSVDEPATTIGRKPSPTPTVPVVEPATTIGRKPSPTPTVPFVVVITAQQLEQAVTVRYSGISLERPWVSNKTDEFRSLVFALLYGQCDCELTNTSQVHVVPHTPYSDGNGTSIAFFITNLNGQLAINSEAFYQILVTNSSRLQLLAFFSGNVSVEVIIGVADKIWLLIFNYVTDLKNDILFPWVPLIAAAGLVLVILVFRMRQYHYWSRHRAKVDLTLVNYIVNDGKDSVQEGNVSQLDDKHAVNGDKHAVNGNGMSSSILSQEASEV